MGILFWSLNFLISNWKKNRLWEKGHDASCPAAGFHATSTPPCFRYPYIMFITLQSLVKIMYNNTAVYVKVIRPVLMVRRKVAADLILKLNRKIQENLIFIILKVSGAFLQTSGWVFYSVITEMRRDFFCYVGSKLCDACSLNQVEQLNYDLL